MNYTEFPLIDYINIDEEKTTLYVYTKDKRIIVLHDVCSNMSIDDMGIYVDHMVFGKRMTFMMVREDFSHVEYCVSPREDSKKDFDLLNSFIEYSMKDDEYPPDLLTEPDEGLFEDLI